MNIKNYTSTVPVDRSIQLIEKRLIDAGAMNLSKTVNRDTREIEGIIFQIEVNSNPMVFKLPAKTDKVFKKLWKEVRRPRPDTEKNIKKQASRTAWKILLDWVEVQVSLIELDQVELLEVFLPYCYDVSTDKTFYEKLKASEYKLLTQ